MKCNIFNIRKLPQLDDMHLYQRNYIVIWKKPSKCTTMKLRKSLNKIFNLSLVNFKSILIFYYEDSSNKYLYRCQVVMSKKEQCNTIKNLKSFFLFTEVEHITCYSLYRDWQGNSREMIKLTNLITTFFP